MALNLDQITVAKALLHEDEDDEDENDGEGENDGENRKGMSWLGLKASRLI